ncbi:elongation of very long chain fatty acids protein AAEL008004-like [Vespa velutina]|uniref:elongation of very long chain fatty acids protein AAEL008004-like n=1 Tax=Vespa velutina TaxID=202808 RepID=UPI001FB20277|nr:elongation of very long chain fatty acids protein AAEL008004-like [Vespa velutina]
MDLLNGLFYFIEFVDPRLKNWILFNSPYPIIFILFLYLYFVLVYGPQFMKNRKPYTLRTFIKCYNIFQIMANSLIIYKFLKSGFISNILSSNCEPISYKADSTDTEILEGCWWVLLTKMIDLVETGIFVLRKRNRQISFLHLYHHISTLMISWLFGKHYIDKRTVFIPFMNCSIHVMMYSYYFFTTFGPNVRKIINRYKFILTIIQMVQFIILICFIWKKSVKNCEFAIIPSYVMIINLLINLILFFNFYEKNYSIKNTKKY